MFLVKASFRATTFFEFYFLLNQANLTDSILNYTIMGSNSKFLAGVIVGAAAGAAIALLLNTEKGKQVLADLKDAAGKTIDDLKEAAQNYMDDKETAV